MDYNNNNYNNDSYNSTHDGNNDVKTYGSRDSGNLYDNNYYSQNADNPYEQSGANMEQNFNQTAGGQSPYISSEYSSTYVSPEYSSSYGQNNYQTSYSTTDTTEKEEPVSVLDWVGTLLLTMVPCAALIVYLIWAFGSNTKKSKSNYCKAYLIVALISTVLVIILYIFIFAFAFAAGEFY